jgi:uncharacterized membrane protein
MADEPTLTLFVGRYADVAAATADYDAILESRESRYLTTFDAAVVEHGDDGSVKVVHQHETPLGAGAAAGLLAGATLGIFFPPLLVTMVAGAGVGALVGHMARGLSRADVKEVGEALDACDAALVVVIATTHATEVRIRMTGSEQLTEKEIVASADDIEQALEEAATEK